MNSTNELSNVSYTNKDFNAIYTELLEYAKQFSYKWDPTASDESDPGVVLLKLCALVGDKLNYNIDKNTLELMPASVTQLSSAKQIFDQCGYSMKYYRSAEGLINVTLVHDVAGTQDIAKSEYVYILPRFTMFSDSDNNIIYTATEEMPLTPKQASVLRVMEGTINDYTVNNDSLITFANLDSNNRLYFTELDIPENGIFITNVGKSNYSSWYQVENLEIQPAGSTCYKFGVSLDGSTCYIEFPSDIDLLFGEGLNIKYIRTKGFNGNIAAKKLTQLYVDTKFVKKAATGLTTEEVSVTNDDIKISNTYSITNGMDPESIDSAYKAYKRVRNTFDTLVSITDYTNYLVTSKTASNGFVCDRGNDIQHSYKFKKDSTSETSIKTMLETHEVSRKTSSGDEIVETVPFMTAFDLCVYALTYVPTVSTSTEFKTTFNLALDANSRYKSLLESKDIKSLQHDFITYEDKRILMLRNKYTIKATIIPRYKLAVAEQFAVEDSIRTVLYNKFNSKELEFGSNINYDSIYDAILNADERIKAIALEYPNYKTFVVYVEKDPNDATKQKLCEMRIDSDSYSGGFVADSTITSSDLSNATKQYYYENNNAIVEVPSNHIFDRNITYYYYDKSKAELWTKFRAEIFAKNVLAGVTPLYDQDTTYLYGIGQQNTSEYTGITNITTSTTITGNFDSDTKTVKYRKLEQNENIILTAPSYVEEMNYSSYVKVIYALRNEDVKKNDDVENNGGYSTNYSSKLSSGIIRKLQGNEFVAFFWKAADSDEDYTFKLYDKDSEANLISPSFALYERQRGHKGSKNEYESLVQPAADSGDWVWKSDFLSHLHTALKNSISTTANLSVNGVILTDLIASLNSTKNQHVLAGAQSITTYKTNEICINNKENGSSDLYWILNKSTTSTSTRYNGKEVYRLFTVDPEKNQKNLYTYTLKSGEYFIYTNAQRTVLQLLGQGTKIQYYGKLTEDKECLTTTYEEILTNGIDHLEDKWEKCTPIDTTDGTINKDGCWVATEQQLYQIGPGNTITIEVKVDEVEDIDDYSIKSLNSNHTSNNVDKHIESIKYVDENGQLTIVPKIASTDEEDNWKTEAILNINIDSKNPQVLTKEGQSFTFYCNEVEGEGTTIGLKNNETSPLYIQCSDSLSLLGGENVDVTSVSAIKVRDSVSLLTYIASESDGVDSDNNPKKFFSEDMSCRLEFKFDKNNTSIPSRITARLLPGSYIVRKEHSSNIEVTGTFSGEKIDVYDLNENTTRLHVFSNSGDDVELNITANYIGNIEDDSKAVTEIVTIHSLYKYSTKTLDSINNGESGSGFASGSGTQLDPYIIETPEQLAYLANSVNSGFESYEGKHIQLGANIKLNEEDFIYHNSTGYVEVSSSNGFIGYLGTGIVLPKNNDETINTAGTPVNTAGAWYSNTNGDILSYTPQGILSWNPIGTAQNPFKGTFNGNGYLISGLYINNKLINYQGLFGFVSDGIICNVGVVDSFIHGQSDIGAIVGRFKSYATSNTDVKLQGCFNNSVVIASYAAVGGIVGRCYSVISDCYNSGVVICTSQTTIKETYAGGIVGQCIGMSEVDGAFMQIKNCYNNGIVFGRKKVTTEGPPITVGNITGNPTQDYVSNCYYLYAEVCKAYYFSINSGFKPVWASAVTESAREVDMQKDIIKLNELISDNTNLPTFNNENSSYTSVWNGSTNTSFEVDALLKIKELDVDKEFTYTYTPEDPIKNPLIATSFFNTSHFYNPFTICEWEEDANNTSDITILSTVR